MSETAAEVDGADGQERAILDQMRHVREVHARGDTAEALELHRALVTRYGLTAIADVMSLRTIREQLGNEVELLRVFGPAALYGDNDL